ncbi:MAG: ribonuclease III [Myxococcales bacterium]|nr:ribonuclease III [Myxococcales bacterium]
MALPEALRALLGDTADLPHLEQALTHPSYANEAKRGRREDYQRLEFLGDAVLQLCVSEALFDAHPDAREGELSRMRSRIVSTESLAAFAREVELGSALLLGRGADAAGERHQANVLADALEAVIGAVYLDRGPEQAREVVRAIHARAETELLFSRDPKSELQERVQALGGASPRYELVETSGPDHRREFLVRVEAMGQMLGEGRGRSKKSAEQEAAKRGLLALAERG